MNFVLDWAPVDIVSENIVARAVAAQGPAIEHLSHPTGVSACRLTELACEEWSVEIVDEAEWLQRVADLGPPAPSFPLVGFIREVGGLAAALERTDDRSFRSVWDFEIKEEALRAYLRHVRETADSAGASALVV